MKWRAVLQRARVALRPVLVLAGGLGLLAGCAIGPGGRIMSQEEVEAVTPLQTVPVSNAWVSAPEARLVLQRSLGFGSEQRISLQNRTLVPEDNLIVLRTRAGISGSGALRFDEFMRRTGGAPFPFEDVSSGELVSASDQLGGYFWTHERFGSSTVCVFGIRRIDGSMRQIPGGDTAMDVMLRNCVNGTIEEALQPLLAESVEAPTVARAGADESRLISPLAGPTFP